MDKPLRKHHIWQPGKIDIFCSLERMFSLHLEHHQISFLSIFLHKNKKKIKNFWKN